MSCFKEIGGYFGLELSQAGPFHRDILDFNSGHSALRYLIRVQRIKKLHVPYYTCPVIWDSVEWEGCEFSFYEIGEDFLPVDDLPETDYILYTNYFGGLCAAGGNSCRSLPEADRRQCSGVLHAVSLEGEVTLPASSSGVLAAVILYGSHPAEARLKRSFFEEQDEAVF